MNPGIELRQVAWEQPDAAALRAAQRLEIENRYGTPDSEPGIAPTASDITAFFVAYVDGTPAGCGGVRELSATEAEIKRMFVAADHRGSGVSTAILRRLERFGRERGWLRLVLETGDRQPDAVRFYEREGYARIANFGYYAGNAASLCYSRDI